MFSLEEIEAECGRFPHVDLLVAGDFNARIKAWLSDGTDLRDKLLQDFAARFDLVYENVEYVPKFQSVIGASVIDFILNRLTDGRKTVG